MSEIIGTVFSNYEPPKDKLWYVNGKLKYYSPKGWEEMIKTTAPEISWADIKNKPTFSKVATSGSYNDLKDIPVLGPSNGINYGGVLAQRYNLLEDLLTRINSATTIELLRDAVSSLVGSIITTFVGTQILKA